MKELILDYYATVEQLAECLNVDRETVRRWIRSGKLQANPTGKERLKRIAIPDLIEFLDDRIETLEKDLSDYKKLREYLNQRSGA